MFRLAGPHEKPVIFSEGDTTKTLFGALSLNKT
jgi:hypothetical protein